MGDRIKTKLSRPQLNLCGNCGIRLDLHFSDEDEMPVCPNPRDLFKE